MLEMIVKDSVFKFEFIFYNFMLCLLMVGYIFVDVVVSYIYLNFFCSY